MTAAEEIKGILLSNGTHHKNVLGDLCLSPDDLTRVCIVLGAFKSPVTEGQEELWNEVDKIVHGKYSTLMHKKMGKLKSLFTIIRK